MPRDGYTSVSLTNEVAEQLKALTAHINSSPDKNVTQSQVASGAFKMFEMLHAGRIEISTVQMEDES